MPFVATSYTTSAKWARRLMASRYCQYYAQRIAAVRGRIIFGERTEIGDEIRIERRASFTLPFPRRP